MREADYATWDRLIVKAKKAVLPADQLITARGRGDSAAVRRHLDGMRRDARSAPYTTRYLWIYFEDAGVAEQAGRNAVDVGPEPQRVLTALALSELDLARGRWQAAADRLKPVEAVHPFYAQTLRRVYATLPFYQLPRAELERIRAELESWDSSAPASITDATVRAMMPHARSYMLALIHARLGDHARALALADELKKMPNASEQPALVDGLVRTVYAQVAAQEMRYADVVSLLQPVRGQIPLPLLRRKDVVPIDFIFAQDHARFLRGRALRELGRFDEALTWLSTSFIGTAGEMLYRAPLHFELAQAYESMRNPQKAREHYARFIDAWQGADAAVQPQVGLARTRLARLAGEN